MSRLHFDTCFLIDLEREAKRGADRAHRFLKDHAETTPCLSWIAAGEFAEGFGGSSHPVAAALLSRFEMLPMSEATAHHYAVITQGLRLKRSLIGTNDLWIAATSLACDLPLVTTNLAHFSRVPGLRLIGY
jgi:tRNA(fMet)-specific endonuclease VapC